MYSLFPNATKDQIADSTTETHCQHIYPQKSEWPVFVNTNTMQDAVTPKWPVVEDELSKT